MWRFIFLLPCLLFSKTICLNMIVKDEAAVIERCLESVKPWIDSWVIVDTGSTDGTQELIRKCLKGIPGELHERPWKNFSHNRNEALRLAKEKGDYLLLIDADEEIESPPSFQRPVLDLDLYWITVREVSHRIDYARAFLVRSALPWQWNGVVHEVIQCSCPVSEGYFKGITNLSRTEEGARSKNPQKYLKDALLLEEALKEEPNCSRTVFYLAQSYLNACEYEKALEQYQRRAKMGGFAEEVFLSIYLGGYLEQQLKKTPEVFTQTFWRAYAFRPSRIEPLFRLATYYQEVNLPLIGYLLAKYALTFPPPPDSLFVEKWIYEWGLRCRVGECAAMLGKAEEAKEILESVLAVPDLPDGVRKVEVANLEVLMSSFN